tara:strand:- start:461 stop:2311 length:1851 start_codon:yes stop_codon:yes gene_type:complete
MTGTGKAGVKKTVIDDIIKLNRQEAKSFGLARQQVSGISSSTILGASGMKGGSDGNNNDVWLDESGGTMMGPIAFYPRVTSIVGGVLDVGVDVSTVTPANAYSSRVICLGGATLGAAIDIDTIANAAFAGQILYLQCVASTFLTLKHGTGNIFSPTGADVSFSNKEIITLQFDSTSGIVGGDWIVSSSFTSGGGGGTGMTNPATAQLDMAAFSIKGAWGGTADTLGIESDLDMNTYDINDVDRVKFSTTIGTGTSLTSTDTGIEAIYLSGVPYGMNIQIPSAGSAVLTIYRGVTEMVNINSLGTVFNSDVYVSNNQIKSVGTPTATTDAANKAYVDASAGMANPATAQLDMATFSIKGDWLGTAPLTPTLGIESDLDMNTYDIIDVDRVKFSTIIGSGTALASTDTGMEAIYNAGLPYGMIIQFPSANSAIMQIKRGTVDMINISSLGILFGDELLMGGFKISNVLDPTAAQDAATKAYVDANLLGSITNDLLPSPTATWDLGSTSKRWAEVHASTGLFLDTSGGRYLKNVGTDIELRTSNTRDILFSEANSLGVSNNFMIMSGVGNNIQFQRSCWFGATADIGFFGTTAVGQQAIPSGASLAQVVTALRNLGLGV